MLLEESGIERDLPYWLLTVRFGQQISAAFAAWGDAALAELNQRESTRRRSGVPEPMRGYIGPRRTASVGRTASARR